jgi:hypothetical protein
MIIHLLPQDSDDRITVEKAGDVLTVNGAAFDFTPLEVDASIPATALDSTYFYQQISRDSTGEITLYLLFPQASNAPYDSRFPLPLSVTEDGPVTLPDTETEVETVGELP